MIPLMILKQALATVKPMWKAGGAIIVNEDIGNLMDAIQMDARLARVIFLELRRPW